MIPATPCKGCGRPRHTTTERRWSEEGSFEVFVWHPHYKCDGDKAPPRPAHESIVVADGDTR